MKRGLWLLVMLGAFVAAPSAYALDGISFVYGDSDSTNADVQLYRLGAQWDWKKRWFDTGSWHLGGYWELDLGYWNNDSFQRTNSSLWDIGFTPVFRFQSNNRTGISPYVEAAIGIRFLSETSVGSQRSFGSSFQFTDHLGLGLRFGDRSQYDLGYRFQHLSNGGLKDPNQGINFHQLRLQYWFQ